MASPAVYLDWNATAPVRAEVVAAMAEALTRCGNPSSVHRFGREARRAIEDARAQVAGLVNAAPAGIVFTSGGTEANLLALHGLPGRRVIISAIEHDSVRQAVPDAQIVPVARQGVVDLDALDRMLATETQPALVSIMLANNETGVVQPIAEAAHIAHARGALFHCDAVQAAGKLPLDCGRLGADLLTLSAHKLGGSTGVGALVIAANIQIETVQTGGGQERGRRAGTENVSGIVGFGVACDVAASHIGDYNSVMRLRDAAQARLMAIAPDATAFGADGMRIPNTLCITMPGVPAMTQVMALDLAGVMVSAGSACSSGKVRRSHVLEAMGVPAAKAESAIRISLGWSTTAADIDRLVDAWGALYARSRVSAA